jgi:hypothetical protein
METHPYENLPLSAFWRTGVTEADPNDMQGVYKKKFDILPSDKIATAGSCFAQHLTYHLKKNGYKVLDLEPPPPSLPAKLYQNYGFSTYSARYGNIYTVRQLLQLANECAGIWQPKNYVWVKGDRFYDALRPSIEPNGFDTLGAVKMFRKNHIANVKDLFCELDVFVFTLGLTEMWVDEGSGTVYPTAPGTLCGIHDPAKFRLECATFKSILIDFRKFHKTVMRLRSGRPFKIVLTVSPVPLTATASTSHILVANLNSKSILRSVAGQLSVKYSRIDYFPSYEIVTNPRLHSTSFMANLRTVRGQAVENAMRHFFREHPPLIDTKQRDGETTLSSDLSGVQCQDEFLDLFAE